MRPIAFGGLVAADFRQDIIALPHTKQAVWSLLTVLPTTSSVIQHPRELVFTNAAGMVGEGDLKRSDRFAVELLASLLAEFRAARYAFLAPKIAHMRLMLGTFGMTPASREGFGLVSLADNKAPNRFSAFT